MPEGKNVGYIREEVKTQLPKWVMVDDAVGGEIPVKAKGTTYLRQPQTSPDPVKNDKQYENFKEDAVFYPVTGRTLEGLIGQVFSKPVATELPSSLEILDTDIDGAGTTLEQQAKQTLAAVLKKGRSGLLSDFPTLGEDQVTTQADLDAGRIRPRIIHYQPEQIINWREKTVGGETILALLVLSEEAIINDDGFEFETSPRWRVYEIDESGFVMITVYMLTDDEKAGNSAEYIIEDQFQPTGSNDQPLTIIPFSFVGSVNNDSTVDESPLYPLATLNLHHFHDSANYQQSVTLCGQPMPVFTGLTDQWVKDHIKGQVTLGSANAVSLPQGASASLLQAQPNTLPMEAMTHKEDQMKSIGAKLIEPGTVQRTATEAEIEETSEASVLSSVTKNVSSAYKSAFYFCSLFGDDVQKEDIVIALNSEFQVMGLNAAERTEVMKAWQGGLITFEEARDIYKKKGIATLEDSAALTKINAAGVDFGEG